MKSSTARWTTALAVTACLATPTIGWSQTPPTSQPPTTQQQPAAQQPPSASKDQASGEAQEHLHKAQAALKDIPATIPAKAKSRVAELKRHLSTLEKSAGPASTPGGAPAEGAKPTARGKSNWSKEVAAIDKILTDLLGPASPSGATQPTGTTGAAGSKSGSTAMTLDETTKSKLMEVRTHITAFAAAMSGTGGDAASAASAEPAADPGAAAATQPTTQSSPATSSPTASPQSAGQQPATQNPTGAEQAQQPPASAGQPGDPEASKRHLTAARESLSQLTQLPAAAQLSGEARTQVSQLISNFNELITTKENWRESYGKLEANLAALVGPETGSQSAPAPAAPTGGAVGTSGSTAASLDPAIRAKLVEFRSHLKQFEQAAGVADQASAAASSSPSSTAGQPTSSSSSSMPGQSASPTTSSPTTSPAGQSTAGTTGTTPPSPEQPSASAMGQDSAVRHIDAIEAILSGRSSSSSSSAGATTGNAPAGTTGTTTGNITLNQSQVEEIRMHLAELRKAVDKK